MGLFEFVKDAGEKLLRPGAAAAAEAADEAAKADMLSGMIGAVGLNVTDLKIGFDDGVATVHGYVASPADMEKVVLVLGNTQGVAKVDNRLELEEALGPVQGPELPPPSVMYTVQRGDTLSKIAKEHYGSGSKYPVIFEANKPMLKDPDKIYPGQVLRIPPVD